MSRTDAEILDREDVNDLDAILAVSNSDIDEAIHVWRPAGSPGPVTELSPSTAIRNVVPCGDP